ncbi:microtubule-associated protein tau isoform X2 [Halyomorpha halys]|uniref:microtubule-associated protein tau isoform X2 n=1 Tax=Halyomorpha halys TaxID=286706 RepID=UPI0034D2BE07
MPTNADRGYPRDRMTSSDTLTTLPPSVADKLRARPGNAPVNVEERGGKQEEVPPQGKPRIQPQIWPRPQNRPLPQQQHYPQQFQQQDYSNQGDSQDRRKSVTFGPALRKDIPPDIRPPPVQQGVVIRRPSPWAVLRAKLPTGENLPVLRPVISNEHFIQRMQNPEAASRPPSRPPLSRPGSQESVRPPYIQRNDSVVGRPPSSPRPPAGPMRPPSRNSMSSKDEEDETITNDMKGGQGSMTRPNSGQKVQGQQNQMPTTAQSPIIQIANHPQNTQNPMQMNQPMRIQQNPVPSNLQPQTIQQHNQAPMSQTTAPTMPSKPQATVPTNQQAGQQSYVQGIPSQNYLSQQQQNINTQQPQQPQNQMQSQVSTNNTPSLPVQNQAPVIPANGNQTHPPNSVQSTPAKSSSQTPAQISSISIPQAPAQNYVPNMPPNSTPQATVQNPIQNAPSSGPQAPAPNSVQNTTNSGPQTTAGPIQPATVQNTVPSSPVGARRPDSGRPTNPMPSLQKQESITANNEENKVTKPMETAAEIKPTQNKPQQDTAKEQKDSPKKLNGLQEKPMHKPPIIVDATLKRPMDLKSPSVTRKAEETGQTTKENEPPRPESSKKESTPSKEQEPAVVNGNHESPKKSKTAPPKKLGTAQSPLKSPNKPLPKTPETPGSADKKIPMNKVQVGAAPSPNLKSVKSKIGSLENAKHKPGGGNIKIEHRKLNFNVAPKIEAKNDTYTPGGGDKKIQQVKLQWNAKPKVGSLDNAAHKPGGGDKKIESVKLDFKEKAKPKVGSKDNIKHVAGGGTVKNSDEHLDGNECDIEDQKLDVKAQSKVGSLDNVKYKPGGGDKKIFDDKEYLKQMASTSMDSLNQERKKRSRCNSTSSQDSKYKSDDKLGSRLSLKSEGQKDQLKEKSPQRPTDQNSNQVNDKNTHDSQSKSSKSDEQASTIKIKTNGLNYQGVSKDANGNGKMQETYKDELRNDETKIKNEIYEQSSVNKQQTIPSITDDKKPPIKPITQPYQNTGTVHSKEPISNFGVNDSVNIINQARPSMPNISRPQISPPSQTTQKNISGLPPNVRLARDLINETSANDGIVEKSLTEKTEKETRPLDPTRHTQVK